MNSIHFPRRYICVVTILVLLSLLAGMYLFSRWMKAELHEIVSHDATLEVSVFRVIDYRNSIIVVNLEKELQRIRNGNIVASRKFEHTITSVAANAKTGRIYLTTILGSVYCLNDQFEMVATINLNGYIMAIATLDSGEIAVSYSPSFYSPVCSIAILDEQLSCEEVKIPTGFSTPLLSASGNCLAYGTVDSRLGMISASAKPLWEKTLLQRPYSISIIADKNYYVLIGDKAGSVALYDFEGERKWQKKLSQKPVTLVAGIVEDGIIVAGDNDGTVYVCNEKGELLVRSESSLYLSSYVGYWGNQGMLRLMNVYGEIKQIDIRRASQLVWVPDIFRILRGSYAVIVCCIIICVIKNSSYLTNRYVNLTREIFCCRTAYFLLLPTIVLLLLFSYYPIVTAFYYSFTDFSLSSVSQFIGLNNFKDMINDPYLWIGFKNMLIFLCANIFKILVAPLLAAELIFWLSGERLKQFLRTAFVVPTIVPVIVMVLLWRMIYSPYDGLLNKTLELVGLSGYTHAWLAEENFALGSILFAGFPWIGAFPFLVYLGGLIAISKDIYEAAEIDGITSWHRFFRIDLPLLRSQISLLLTFVFIWSIQDFTSVLIFTKGGPGFATYVPALHMYYEISEGANIGYACSIGIVLFAIIMIAFLINIKLIKPRDY